MSENYFEIDSKEGVEDIIIYNKEVTSLRKSFVFLLKNAFPAYFAIIIEEISTSIMIAFVGHLGNPNEIAALGISETFALLFYTYPVLANMGAVDTLVSTSFGNKQYYL